MAEDKGPKGSGTDSAPATNQISAPTISLPKGGGAIHGMGEKFAANPVTGTGSMSVPIATSPGRGGFGPQLSLSYDSGSGNGPFGLGWNLSLPSITRKTDKGLPKYRDVEESDVFILSGAEDLVPEFEKNAAGNWILKDGKHVIHDKPRTVDGVEYKVRRYRPRIEGLFARIERWTDAQGVSHWRSTSKDNITTLYGRAAESQIVDPADPARIFSWSICESYDDKGNAIRYQYKVENADGIDLSATNERNRSRSTQSYLKRIKYGNKTPHQRGDDLSQHSDNDWMFEAVFDYGEHYIENGTTLDDQSQPTTVRIEDTGQPEWAVRQDPFSSYRAGFEVRTYRLCRRVLMFHHFDELEDPAHPGGENYLVRATHFAYNETTVASFITGVTQSGYKRIDGIYRKKSLPPVEFTYSEAVIQDEVHEVDAASLENLPQGLDHSRYQWADLDGEGLSGILTEQGGACFYKRNQSAVPVKDPAGKETTVAHFAPLECVATMPSLANLSGGQQLLDLAGDGQLDVVDFDGPAPGFFERTPDEEWDTHKPFTSLPNIAWRDPNLKFIDLTGDGHADILITEDDAFSWYPSLAEAGFGPGENVRQAIDEERGPRLVFADGTQSIYLADMSGDGLTDLVRIRNGDVCYWPNLGYGRFGAKVTMDKAPWFDAPDMFDQRRIRLADIDGSGLVDILYLTGNGVHLYFNQSGNAWSERRLLNTFPRIDNLSAISTVDLLGNGTACLVWSSPLPGDARSTIRYIDLMGGQKPHLLIKTVNNLGGETEVTYAPSTKFYLQDKQAGTPWITKLPFPVHCVEKVTVRDQWRQTEFASTYSYHHGYFDGIEREFRGFGRIEQRDVENYGKFMQGNIASPYITDQHDLYQPPIKTITWYHTGAAFERNRVLSALKHEYVIVPGFTEHQLPEPTLTPADLSAKEWREALRACKGMILRQEVFELDVDALDKGEELRVRLYTTAYHNSDITRVQPQGMNRHAVFLVTESEAITYNYELDLRQETPSPDPRIAHALNLRFDAYGRALQTLAVVYPRLVPYADPTNTLKAEQLALIHNVQSERHIAYTETHFTAELPEDPDRHRLPAPCEVLTYELTGANSTNGFVPSGGLYFSLDDLKAFALSDTLPGQGGETVVSLAYHAQPTGDRERAHKRIVEWVRTLYFKDDLSGPLDFGQPSRLGLTYETYKLALTSDLLNAVFGAKLTADVLTMLNTATISGYIPGTALSPSFTNQWWMRSGVAGFASDAARHFYLPEEYTDPFNNKTTLKYDELDLFIQSSTDAKGNTSGVWIAPAVTDNPLTGKPRFDYRVLAPKEMVDINGNRTEVYFDILGMVVASAIKGKGQEADSLTDFDDALANPSASLVQKFCISSAMDAQQADIWLGNATARFVYHFGEERDAHGNFIQWVYRSAGVCGIVRERHASQVALDLAHKNPLQVSLECSDGSGNVLMKKVQAEPDPELPPASQKPRWIVNGFTVLNNKGTPVKQYEPDFSKIGFGCELPQANGVCTTKYYDAPGRLIRTEMPDGTLSRVEFTPWQVKTFDANDTVLEKDSTWYQNNGRNRFDPATPLPTDPVTKRPTATPDERAGWLAAQHANTPAETHFDSLGREVIAIAHNRARDGAGVVRDEKYFTFTKLDAEGKPLWIRDARGNLVMQYINPPVPNNQASDPATGFVPCYDTAGNLLFQHSMDAGDRWMLMDAAGKPMLAWDFNKWQDQNSEDQDVENRLYLTDYDALHRPVAAWLRINDGNKQMIERFEYLDTRNADGTLNAQLAANQTANLIGQLVRHYDPSGRIDTVRRDFKGNATEVRRHLNNTPAVSLIDWKGSDPAVKLEAEAETFVHITEFDALNRMTTLYNWHRDITFRSDGTQQATPGHTNRVAIYVPAYNARGSLQSEKLYLRAIKTTDVNGKIGFDVNTNLNLATDAIKNVIYNAKGQKENLTLGNESVTTYTYDSQTFRLINLHTRRGRVETCGAGTSSAFVDGHIVQDLHYTYDPVGNITEIRDPAFKDVFFQNQRVEPINRYEYDALYRLVKASGRENGAVSGAPTNIEPGPLANLFACVAADAFRNYGQTFHYDRVGNIEQVGHQAGNGSWARDYAYAFDDPAQPASNRLWQTSEGVQAITYHYDTHGNMLNLANVAAAQYMRWDYRDMIGGIDLGGGGTAFYQYDANKQRTRKRIENQNGLGGYWERIYLGGYELYRRYNGASPTTPIEEIESHHLFEGEQRVLLVDDVITASGTGPPRPDGLTVKAQTLFRYQYSNHLGSACLELDEQAEIISYEEYHPYGTSAYRAKNSGIEVPPKRYRYTGMERDEESGLSYHSARYYAAWLDRWLSPDPSGISDGANLYRSFLSNPSMLRDPSGRQSEASFRLPERFYKPGALLGVCREPIPGVGNNQATLSQGSLSDHLQAPIIPAPSEDPGVTATKAGNSIFPPMQQKMFEETLRGPALALSAPAVAVGLGATGIVAGSYYLGTGDYDKAIAAFSTSLEVLPNVSPKYALTANQHMTSAIKQSQLTLEREWIVASLAEQRASHITGPKIGYLSGEKEAIAKMKAAVAGDRKALGEVQAVDTLLSEGTNVHWQTPVGRKGPTTADLLVGGEAGTGRGGAVTDVYTPDSAIPANIILGIVQKNKQAPNIILNLSHTSVTSPELGDVMSRVNQGFGATNIKSVRILHAPSKFVR